MRATLVVRLILLFVVLSLPSYGKQIENEGLPSNAVHRSSIWYSMVEENHANVLDVMRQMQLDTSATENNRSREWRQALHWIAKRRPFADASGMVTRLQHTPQEIELALQARKQIESEKPLASGTWQPVGPFSYDKSAQMATSSQGIGVVRTLLVDPTDGLLLLAGTISSGIWRSTDGGATWMNVGIDLPIQTVSRFAMSGTTVYAATDAGLYVSTDRGITFRTVGLKGDDGLSGAVGVDFCAVAPTDARRVVITTVGRLFLTTNGGISWKSAGSQQGTWWDLRWHTTRNNIVYGLVQNGGHIAFVRSTSSGVKFDRVGIGYPENSSDRTMHRALIAVTPSVPSYVSVMVGGKTSNDVGGVFGLYVSTDEGSTFIHRCCGNVDGPEPADSVSNKNLFDYDPTKNGLGQITWDMGFAVSTKDTSALIAAGIFPYTSTDGGRTWRSMPAMHYDIQSASFIGDTIWLSHDGGITQSIDRGVTIKDRSDGISAMEIWGFDQSHDGKVMALGAYHLPIFMRDTSVYSPVDPVNGWYAWAGADAMGANVNPVATEWVYAKPWASVRAQRTRTNKVAPQGTDLGLDLGYITLSNICVDPGHCFTLVACDHTKQSVMISRDNGGVWSTLKKFTNWVYRVRMYAENGNHLLALGDQKLWRSTDQGQHWLDVTPPPSIAQNKGLQDMAFGSGDPEHVIVCFGGIQADAKVAESFDGGLTWSDISAGLPSFAIKTLISRRASANELYVGTSFGVYRWARPDGWKLFGSGLPISDINFLNCDEPNGVLRCASQRGLWQIALPQAQSVRALMSRSMDTLICNRTPVKFSCRSAALENINFTRMWYFPGGTPESSSLQSVDVLYPSPGSYDATLIVLNDYGADTSIIRGAVVVLPSECDRFDRTANRAADCTDPDDHVTLGRLSGTVGAFTFTAWVKPSGMQPSFSAVLCSDADQGVEQEIGMQFVSDKNEIGYLWKDGRWWWNSGLVVQPNAWSHVALTIDTNGATVYVNGIGRSDVGKLPKQNLSALIMKLGTYHYWASRNYSGLIDEVCFYNVKLSEDDVRLGMHRTKRKDEKGLIAYYQFNESVLGVVFDKINGRNGTLESGAAGAPSEALVGDAETEIIAMQSGVRSIMFPTLKDEIDLTNTVEGGRVLLSRMLVDADSLPKRQFIENRFWILDVFGVDGRAHEVERISLSSELLMSRAEASTRMCSIYTRSGWQAGSQWTNVLTKADASFDVNEQVLQSRMQRGVSAPHQWALSISGGPVGVAESQPTLELRVSPQPCSEYVTIDTDVQHTKITIMNLLGVLVKTINSSSSNSSIVDVGDVSIGVYVIDVHGSRQLIQIHR